MGASRFVGRWRAFPKLELILFFFNDTATTEIYTTVHTLSLHDALPIYARMCAGAFSSPGSTCSHGQPSSTIRSCDDSRSRATAGSACSLIVTPAVVCGTYTRTADPRSPATTSRTWRVISTSSVRRSVLSLISRTSESAAGGGRRARLERVLSAGRPRHVLLDLEQVALSTLHDREQLRHRRDLLALFLQEPVEELLPDELPLLPGELHELDDLVRHALLLLERERHGGDRVAERRPRPLDSGDRDLLVGVEKILHHHHRVV